MMIDVTLHRDEEETLLGVLYFTCAVHGVSATIVYILVQERVRNGKLMHTVGVFIYVLCPCIDPSCNVSRVMNGSIIHFHTSYFLLLKE